MEDWVTVLKEKGELETIVGGNIGRLLNRLKETNISSLPEKWSLRPYLSTIKLPPSCWRNQSRGLSRPI